MNRKKALFMWTSFLGMCAILLPLCPTYGLTVAEKKQSLKESADITHPYFQEELNLVNESLWEKKLLLKTAYKKAQELYEKGAERDELAPLISKIDVLRKQISHVEGMWIEENRLIGASDDYALWHAPNVTLDQLVMEYGTNAIYLVPPHIGQMHVSIHSTLAIPSESWEQVLQLILTQNGVGVRELSPFVRELYLLGEERDGIGLLTNKREDLEILPNETRVCFVLSPYGTSARRTLHLLEKFSSPSSAILEIIGGQIFIVAPAATTKELLKLHEFIEAGGGASDYQLVTLTKIEPKEMTQMLNSAFHLEERRHAPKGQGEEEMTLQVIPLDHLTPSLFLVGSKEEVQKAKEMIVKLEGEISDPKEKTIFWYTAKHSEAADLADVLGKVYGLLASESFEVDAQTTASTPIAEHTDPQDSLIVHAPMVKPLNKEASQAHSLSQESHIVIDPKTGSLIMVVEKAQLPKIKDLLKRLDVPKKMVQIEVLLFEKRISHKSQCGLNLLRLGSAAVGAHATSLGWNPGAQGVGILEFLISRKKGSGIPAYDFAYNFMLGQEDVQINASPSITTVNQTPATIAIVEEISINNGTYEVEGKKRDRVKDSFERAQYGITMQITPTINIGEENLSSDEDNLGFITLDTDITFDTTKKNASNRPDVTRRHIKNHVRIADGQTVILGGLRRKSTEDNKDSIPFLGEIPGIGKLFSTSGMSDSSTEMFVFITPKILSDPLEETKMAQIALLKKRPGDVPEFLHQLQSAKKRARKKFFEGTFTALFGRQESHAYQAYEDPQEYDGKS